MAARFAWWERLDGAERSRLEDLVGSFVASKRWEGVSGFEVTDEVRVVVAVHACMLILELDATAYRRIGSVVVYRRPVVSRALRSYGGGIVSDAPMPIHGETRAGGPVVITWSAAEADARRPELGRNVVYHEFSHQLDLLDGVADGSPPLRDPALRERWDGVVDAVYERLLAQGDPLLGAYAATNRGELFAVATERFFTRPLDLEAAHPGLYAVLSGFYRQDPASRIGWPAG
jgi:MtfA peptidase